MTGELKKILNLDYERMMLPMEDLRDCNLCPRNCSVDRLSGKMGYCKADASFSVSSVCIHNGEEPVISGNKGICNIFFTNCNMQCSFCQNHQISNNNNDFSDFKIPLQSILKKITDILDTGINMVGFVSPSHFIPQMKVIINSLRELGYKPVFVYNTNAYDKAEVIRTLVGYIDVYLPDFKFMDNTLALLYSKTPRYSENALGSIKEMYRQVGSELKLNDLGYASSGMVIRHLVLPGHVDNSLKVLQAIAAEISPDIHISLMSQYYPSYQVRNHEKLGRHLKPYEYFKVMSEMERLGMHNGWVQELESHENYRPDFNQVHPFEN